MIRALGFDFDHTLGLDNKLERVAFIKLLEEIGDGGGSCSETLANEIACIDRMLAAQRAGECSIEEAVEAFASDRGASNPSAYVATYKRLALKSVPYFVVAQPEAKRVLETLRTSGVPHAILTNGWSPLQERKARQIGFTGPVLVSSIIGRQKPQAQAFAALAAALQCDASEVAYVGDNPETDVAGAIAAGMQGIWFDAEGAAYPGAVVHPTEVIHSLAELLTLP